MAITQILDDRDPGVVYSSGWLQAGSSNEFKGTTTYANTPGLTATLVFQGSQVTVVGTIGARNAQLTSPQTSYAVDGGTTVNFQASQTTAVQYSTRFYASPLLPNGQHTLVVTNLLTSDAFFIDYFLVLRPDVDNSAGASTNHTSPVNTAGDKSSDTGTIVGSAIGAAALVIVAIAIMFWLRARNKRNQDDPMLNSFRGPSIDVGPPMTQSIFPQSGSHFASTSQSNRSTSPNYQGYQPQMPFDPYDPSALAPPPGYASQASQSSSLQTRPAEPLPSKFMQGHRATTSTGG